MKDKQSKEASRIERASSVPSLEDLITRTWVVRDEPDRLTLDEATDSLSRTERQSRL
jgi:hypothetical protein